MQAHLDPSRALCSRSDTPPGRLRRSLPLLLLACVIGCGRSDGLARVGGTVTLDGAPLDGALVTFHPQADSAGNGGSGVTDAAGRFVLLSPQAKKGISPGDYRITVSRRKMSPEVEAKLAEAKAAGVAPMVSAADMATAAESVPAAYTDPKTSTLTRTVGTRSETVDIRLDAKAAATGTQP